MVRKVWKHVLSTKSILVKTNVRIWRISFVQKRKKQEICLPELVLPNLKHNIPWPRPPPYIKTIFEKTLSAIRALKALALYLHARLRFFKCVFQIWFIYTCACVFSNAFFQIWFLYTRGGPRKPIFSKKIEKTFQTKNCTAFILFRRVKKKTENQKKKDAFASPAKLRKRPASRAG